MEYKKLKNNYYNKFKNMNNMKHKWKLNRIN